jgi:ribosomal protein S18 acetylase RimI-like enzyme
MLFTRPITARPALAEDRNRISAFIRYETRVHVHLDWRPPEDWLGEQPYWIVERGSRLIAVLACPPDLPDLTWIRLLALADGVDPLDMWSRVWPEIQPELSRQGLREAAALSLEPWSARLFEAAGFRARQSIVVLARPRGQRLSEAERVIPARVRLADLDDSNAIISVDRQAFSSPWHLSDAMIRHALRQADRLTVAEQDGQVVGYQLTTAGATGVHLARLAVRPDYQGRGIGAALVRHLIDDYNRRGGREISVNTQADNSASLRVYEQMGFARNGVEIPVYRLGL